MLKLSNGVSVSLYIIKSVTILATKTIVTSIDKIIHLGKYPKSWNRFLEKLYFINPKNEFVLFSVSNLNNLNI
jgi:hypothetical protein